MCKLPYLFRLIHNKGHTQHIQGPRPQQWVLLHNAPNKGEQRLGALRKEPVHSNKRAKPTTWPLAPSKTVCVALHIRAIGEGRRREGAVDPKQHAFSDNREGGTALGQARLCTGQDGVVQGALLVADLQSKQALVWLLTRGAV